MIRRGHTKLTDAEYGRMIRGERVNEARDASIYAQRRTGASLQTIATKTGLSRATVRGIYQRECRDRGVEP